MNSSVISRRSAMIAFAAGVVLPALAHADAAPARFRAIQVDVGPLRRTGDAISADAIAALLPALMQHYFAAYLAPGDRGAPVLVARIDSVMYGPQGSAGGPFATSTIDYIEGAGVVVGGGGRQVASYSLLSAVSARPDLNDMTGESGRLRVTNLAQSFAAWLPGKMGL